MHGKRSSIRAKQWIFSRQATCVHLIYIPLNSADPMPWWLSELSRLIYVKGDKETDKEQQTACHNHFLHKINLEERWFYNGKHIQCAIMETLPGYGKGFSALVFRGTQGRISNWLFNLSTALSPWPSGGLVHNGFKLLLMEAWLGRSTVWLTPKTSLRESPRSPVLCMSVNLNT